jgi:hypothetical protein
MVEAEGLDGLQEVVAVGLALAEEEEERRAEEVLG